MSDSNAPNTPPTPPESEQPKPDQKDSASSAQDEEKKDEAPTLDIPAKSEEKSVIDEVLSPLNTDAPKPPALTPPPMPALREAQKDAAERPKSEKRKEESDRYDVPPALGEVIGQNIKDLGLGGQIALGGAVVCFFSSVLWSWEPKAQSGVEWFVVLIMLLMSVETIALICLLMPDKFAEWRETIRSILFIPGGHLALFALIGLLFGERCGAVICLLGAIVICVGNYIAVQKAKNP